MEAGHPDVGDELAAAYVAQGVPCPFLENERCTIYAQRPAVCREHLVTSPPPHCGEPGQEIDRVLLLARVSPVLFRFGEGVMGNTARAVPLALALAWAERRGEEGGRALPGTRVVDQFLRAFSRTQLRREIPPNGGAP